MPTTTYGRQHGLDHMIGKTTYTKPTLWAALFALSPGASGTQSSEITQFARIEVTSKFAATDASGIAQSNADVNFGVPASDGSPAAYIGYLDASSAGNMTFYEQLPSPRAVIAGARALKFLAGQLSIRWI